MGSERGRFGLTFQGLDIKPGEETGPYIGPVFVRALDDDDEIECLLWGDFSSFIRPHYFGLRRGDAHSFADTDEPRPRSLTPSTDHATRKTGGAGT